MASRIENESPKAAAGLALGPRGNSEELCAAFYREFYPKLVGYLARRTGDSALAEDIAQETLLKALTAPDSFDHLAPRWPWMKTVAFNLAVDHMRRSKREIPLEPKDNIAWNDDLALPEPWLQRAVGKLPARQRAALSLRYLNQWRSAEAAAFLGITPNAFEQLLFRAKKRLRAEYKRLSGEISSAAGIPVAWVMRVGHRLAHSFVVPERTGWLLGSDASSLSAVASALSAVLLMGPVATGGTNDSRHRVNGPATVAVVQSQHAQERRALKAHAHKKHGGQEHTGRAQRSAGPELDGFAPPGTGREPTHRSGGATPPRSGGVNGPEDTKVTDVEAPERSAGDGSGSKRRESGTLFAAGQGDCGPACNSYLFRSNDSGATWKRLPAYGFLGADILLPPGFPNSDARIFAMGESGLQVSEDAGRNFVPATTAGAVSMPGSATISPAFHEGDPTILIGAETLLRYDDQLSEFGPVSAEITSLVAGLRGPFEPTFLPPGSRHVFALGAVRPRNIDAINDTPGLVSVVYVCEYRACNWRELHVSDGVPRVRLSNPRRLQARAFVFTDHSLSYSDDNFSSLQDLATPWWEKNDSQSPAAEVSDLVAVGDMVSAAVSAENPRLDGLWHSRDAGGNWRRVASPILRNGVDRVFPVNEWTFAALSNGGLACSADHGETWAKACNALN